MVPLVYVTAPLLNGASFDVRALSSVVCTVTRCRSQCEPCEPLRGQSPHGIPKRGVHGHRLILPCPSTRRGIASSRHPMDQPACTKHFKRHIRVPRHSHSIFHFILLTHSSNRLSGTSTGAEPLHNQVLDQRAYMSSALFGHSRAAELIMEKSTPELPP